MLGLRSLCRIELRMLKDGVNVDTVQCNFTQYRENAEILKRVDGALLANIKRSEQLRCIFLIEDSRSPGEFAWREMATAGYEATLQEFLKWLSVSIHIRGGQIGWSDFVLSARVLARCRLFWEDEAVAVDELAVSLVSTYQYLETISAATSRLSSLWSPSVAAWPALFMANARTPPSGWT
jgi:hypothetical protein